MNGATGAATEIIPVVFDGHSGSLHRPSTRTGNGAAVIICAPAGRDARWTYRALFHWAEQLACEGYLVLRYDLLGEGDSLGLDDAADQWAAWVKGVRQAADFVRTQTGVSQLFVCGLRIGATLACVAAEDVKPDGLILWDPLPSGKAWLKELRLAYAMQIGAHSDDDTIECNGLYLSAATIQALEAVDIAHLKTEWPPLLLASPVGAKKLLSVFGDQADSTPFAGYTLFFKDSYVNQAPDELFKSTRQWLEKHLAPSATIMPSVPSGILQADNWREERVCFGQGLRGVLCLPLQNTGGQAVIFGNTGGDPRAGVANFSTRASRLLAAQGIAALRFDFSGLGESEGSDVHVYETDRTPEIKEAAVLLTGRGFADVTTAGVCTGGFHAVRAVLGDSGISRAVAINAWLLWEQGRELDRAAHVESMRSVYLKAPVQARKWVRLAREALHSHILSRLAGLKRSFFPHPAAQAARLQFAKATAARDIHIQVLAGAMDLSLEGLEHFGPRGRWLARQKGISIAVLPELDHALTTKKSQKKAIKALLSFLSATSSKDRTTDRSQAAPAANDLPSGGKKFVERTTANLLPEA